MAFSLTNHRVPSQCGYQDTRSSFQGKSHFGQTSSSFCDGDARVVRNYNNVHDLTWKFQEFFSENEQAGAPPAYKRRRSSIIENPSATNYRSPFCSGDLDRTDRSWCDINSNSTTTLLRHTANPYNAPSTSSSFVFQTRADDRLGAFSGYNYEPRSYSDNVSTSDNSRESSQGFMSREELERCSPSRKDGIDLHRETYLRYSYCAFLQNLGMQLKLPQTSIGTAIVLCHRFFVRRSHACHDRFLIATASLFLAAKSEETARPLNTVLKAAFEICHEHNFPFSSRANWFEEYKEQVLDAEHIILTTLDFELGVQHPYVPLTSVLNKLGIRQSVLVNLAWSLINEGLRSSLWLQFKPHHIAAGAVFLASKILNMDLFSNRSLWLEFQATPLILQDIVQQLMELL
ncbi:cyclin-T1-4-like isoform X1 [Nymphaea colorata]|nr:cyclin-T1-4-like isoform X1 [Nymphaea colorata]XP_031504309.1 cyclin-T1-4-like isoform X1 [Nymphaea colorata]